MLQKGVPLHDINEARQNKVMGPLVKKSSKEDAFRNEVLTLHTMSTKNNDPISKVICNKILYRSKHMDLKSLGLTDCLDEEV